MKNYRMILMTSLALAAGLAGAADKPKKFNAAAEVKELEKTFAKRMPFADKFEAYGKLLERDDFRTNATARLLVYDRQSGLCMVPGWTALKEFDPGMMDRVFPSLIPPILASGDYNFMQKKPFLSRYVTYLANHERYDEARALIEKSLADWKVSGRPAVGFLDILCDLEYAADSREGVLAALKRIEEVDPQAAARKGFEYAGRVYSKDLRKQFVAKMDLGSLNTVFSGWSHPTPDDAERDLVYGLCAATNCTPANLYRSYQNFFRGRRDDPRRAELRAKIAKFTAKDFAGVNMSTPSEAWSHGDWALVKEIWGDAVVAESAQKDEKKRRITHDPRVRRMYVMSLANLGEKDLAAKTADEFAKEEGLAEKDMLKYRYIAAIIRGQPTADLLKGTTLSAKDQSEVVRTAGRDAVTMELSDTAERLAKEYKTFFADKPVRRLKVGYSKDAVRGFALWRRLYPTLEKGRCDLPFGADVEALVTDVNTARDIRKATDQDNLDAMMEISSVCDRYGLHIFIRVADRNADKVEHGFASGITTEMYFAPGDNEPYQCFGSDPVKGVTWGMNTSYDHRGAKRIDFSGKLGCGFKSEVEFTPEDYVLHMQFDWDNFYQKLPVDGREWKFECLAWAPGGAKSWGGSRGIHHSSDWGRLVFSLKPAEIREIKRELILATYKGWRKIESLEKEQTLDVFDRWADPVVGDPAFYAKCLKAMEAELAGYQKLVKPDMTDETVDLLFEKAFPKWRGISHEIDLLRRQYLEDALVSGN